MTMPLHDGYGENDEHHPDSGTEIARLSEGKKIPEFRAGDTVNVLVNVIEGTPQAYPGL